MLALVDDAGAAFDGSRLPTWPLRRYRPHRRGRDPSVSGCNELSEDRQPVLLYRLVSDGGWIDQVAPWRPQNDRLIVEAVMEATEPVRTILNLVRDDFNTILALHVTTGQAQVAADLIMYYNENRRTMSYDERRFLLSETAAAFEGNQIAIVGNPAALVDAIWTAHESLIKVANSPRKPPDFTEFNAALEGNGSQDRSDRRRSCDISESVLAMKRHRYPTRVSKGQRDPSGSDATSAA